jgi:predicted nucleotide-binding protein (sugar kinase/HSP70/actin superfamily)
VLWWDYTYRTGDLAKTLYEEKACMEELLAFDNVKLFSFQADPDIVCNLDNYMDGLHFRPEINHQMCDAMAEGRYQILSDQDIDACLDGIRSNIRSFEESEQQ